MEHEPFLQTISQVGATLAGLAAVVGAFRPSPTDTESPFIIRDVVEISIIATILALLPYFIYQFVGEDLSWRLACGIWLILSTIGGLASFRRAWTIWTKRLPFLIFTIGVMILGGLWFISAIVGYYQRPDVTFLFGVILLLGMAGYLFVTVLLATRKET